MPSPNGKILRIRYRQGTKLRSRLFRTSNPESIRGKASSLVKGRILEVRKVSMEELFHVGEKNRLPVELMREFRQSELQRRNRHLQGDEKHREQIMEVEIDSQKTERRSRKEISKDRGERQRGDFITRGELAEEAGL